MNVLIGLAIVLVLMLSDSLVASATEFEIRSRIGPLFLLAFAAPLFALAQVQYFRHWIPRTTVADHRLQSMHRCFFWTHLAIWLFSSLAIAGLLHWPQTVRLSWHLNHWPLIDEILILLPMLTSLVASWFILFDLNESSGPTKFLARERLDFVVIRCRVYLLVVLVPIGIMVLLKDFWFVVESLPIAVTTGIVLLVVFSMLCFLPIMIGWMWRNRPIRDDEGRRELLELCRVHHLGVSDIRIWETGNQIVNALVAGIVSRFRLLMITDLLLTSFPHNELRAILRHEAGHIRLRHLPTRIGFIMLPALALAVLELDPNHSLETWWNGMTVGGGISINIDLVLGLLFLLYVVWVTAWLSVNMEFEADLYAIGALGVEEPGNRGLNDDPALCLTNALLRFAEQDPQQYSRRSITHPSLFDRVELIRRAHRNSQAALRFSKEFRQRQLLLAAGILSATLILLLV